MSKRSYRRLAVVAGAALAVGSMGPAMAAHVTAAGTGNATVDASGVTLPSASTLIPGSLITNAETFALDSVSGAEDVALDTAYGVQGDVSNIVEDLFSATSGLSLVVGAGAHASSGGASVQASGVAVGGADVLGLANPGTVLSGVQGHLTPVVAFGTDTVDGALTLADQAKSTVLATGFGAVNTGTTLLNSTSVSVNAIAALMASL